MHARAITTSIVTAVALAALAASPLSRAQGALKPVDALIVNTPSKPVPVTVIPATNQTPTVFCRLRLSPLSSSVPIVRHTQGSPVSEMMCPTGVSRLDVQRVLLASQEPHHRVFLSLGTYEFGNVKIETLITTVSDGAPDQLLARSVRIDVTPGSAIQIIARQVCSSGIATDFANCGGEVYLIGTPAN